MRERESLKKVCESELHQSDGAESLGRACARGGSFGPFKPRRRRRELETNQYNEVIVGLLKRLTRTPHVR